MYQYSTRALPPTHSLWLALLHPPSHILPRFSPTIDIYFCFLEKQALWPAGPASHVQRHMIGPPQRRAWGTLTEREAAKKRVGGVGEPTNCPTVKHSPLVTNGPLRYVVPLADIFRLNDWAGLFLLFLFLHLFDSPLSTHPCPHATAQVRLVLFFNGMDDLHATVCAARLGPHRFLFLSLHLTGQVKQ